MPVVLTEILQQQPLIRRLTVAEAWPGWLVRAGLSNAIPQSHSAAGPRYALLSMALHGAVGGLGVALLPKLIAHAALAQEQLLRLSPQAGVAPYAYYLRWPAD